MLTLKVTLQSALSRPAADELSLALYQEGPDSQRAWDFVTTEFEGQLERGELERAPLGLREGNVFSPLGLMAEWCRRLHPTRWIWVEDHILDLKETRGGQTTFRVDGTDRAAWADELPSEMAIYWGMTNRVAEGSLRRVGLLRPEVAAEALKHAADYRKRMRA